MTAVEGQALCVFCRRRPQERPWRPFCSERCKLQDLARWADGGYRVAAEPVAGAEDDDDDSNTHDGKD